MNEFNKGYKSPLISQWETDELTQIVGYLVGKKPSHQKINFWLQKLNASHLSVVYSDRFSLFLYKKALSSLFNLKMADVFTRLFYPQHILRIKLNIVMAFCECDFETYEHLNHLSNSQGVNLLKLVALGGIFLLTLIMLGPWYLYTKLTWYLKNGFSR